MTLKVIIVGREPVLTRLTKDAGIFLLFGSLIGVGIVADSSAMQWAGFLLAALIVVTRTKARVEQRSFTIGEARKELDRMERDLDAEVGKETGAVPDVKLSRFEEQAIAGPVLPAARPPLLTLQFPEPFPV